MKELRVFSCVLTLSTLCLLGYGATLPGSAAGIRPTITITQPAHGAVVQGNVTVAVAYRSVSGINVTHLEFYIDKSLYKAVKLPNPNTEGTYSFVWDPTGLDAGIHNITAIAYDAKGHPGDVAISIYLDNQPGAADNQAPSLSIANLRNGQTVSGVTHIVAQAVDNVGVKMVMFFLNKRLAYGTNHAPYRYTWDTTKAPNGSYTVEVYAYDAQDNRGEATPVVVNVNNAGGRTLPNESLTASEPAKVAVAPAAPSTPGISKMRDVQSGAFAKVQRPAALPTLPLPKPVLSQPNYQPEGAQPRMSVALSQVKPGMSAAANALPPAQRSIVTKPIVGVASLPLNDMLAGARYLQSTGARTFRSASNVATEPGQRAVRPLVSSARVATDNVAAMLRYLQNTNASFAPAAASMSQPTGTPMSNPQVSASARAIATADMVNAPHVAIASTFGGAASRTAEPRNSSNPSMSAAHAAPQVVAFAAPAVPVTMTGTAVGMRYATPSERTAAPTVTGDAAKAPAVMIALVDRQSHRAVPVAMLMSNRTAEPSAARNELPATAAKPAPVKQLVLTRKGKGTITIVYNGQPVHFPDVRPRVQSGMTLAPFRQIFERGGGSVVWNNLIKQVKASGDGRKVEFTIGNAQAMVNDKSVQMQTAPVLVDGRAIVPLSFVREALGVTVDYDPATGHITIAAK